MAGSVTICGVGMRPAATSDQTGWASHSRDTKAAATTNSRTQTTLRSHRQSSRPIARKTSVPPLISRTPGMRPSPNRSFSAIAPPTSSARSVITMAISADSQSVSTTGRE